MCSRSLDESRPFISVVTPFYNTSEWLSECIESVLSQTYGNFEYLLVDNCSNDGAWEIAQNYARRDSRIRVLKNKQLLSQVQNFNAALALISPQSRYTKVVAGDDALYPTCLEEMIRLAEEHPGVGIVSARAVRGPRMTQGTDGLDDWPFRSSVMCGRTVAKYQLMRRVRFGASPTTVLYRSAIVRARQPFFDERMVFQDMDKIFEILRVWDFGFVARVLTFLRSREGSVTAGVLALDPRAHLMDEFILTRKYGPVFLAGRELSRCRKRIQKVYFEHLARNFLSNRSRQFWEHHERGWKSIDFRVSKWMLIRETALLCLRILGDPPRLGRVVMSEMRKLWATYIVGKGPQGQRRQANTELERAPNLEARRLQADGVSR